MIHVKGLQETLRRAFTMDSIENESDRAYIALRRGIVYMIRELCVNGGTFEALTFAREVTNPVFLRNPERGKIAMERLSETTPNDVPADVWAHASDVFHECVDARESQLNRVPTTDDVGAHVRNIQAILEGEHDLASDVLADINQRLAAILELTEGPPIPLIAPRALFSADNLYDIGGSGITRPRDLNLGRNLIVGGTTSLGGVVYTWPGSQSANKVLKTDGAGHRMIRVIRTFPRFHRWHETNLWMMDIYRPRGVRLAFRLRTLAHFTIGGSWYSDATTRDIVIHLAIISVGIKWRAKKP